MKWRIELEPLSPEGVGLARFLYFGIAVATISVSRLAAYGEFPGPVCPAANGAHEFFSIQPWVSTLGVLFQVSAFFSAVGFLTRFSMLTAFMSLFLMNFNALQFCYIDHRVLPLHVGMFLWCLLDRNSAFRVDDWIFRRGKPKDTAPNAFLPLQMRLYFVVVFFLAGWSKIYYGGWNWVASDSLRNYLAVQNYTLESAWKSHIFVSLNAWVVGQTWLCRVIAFTTIATEIAAPLALFKTKFRNWFVIDLAFLQIGVFVLMYIDFSTWACVYVFWLPLDRWGRRLSREAAR